MTTPTTGTFAYGTDSPSQMLDASWDAGAVGKPAVIIVHGGSWRVNPGRQLMGTAVNAFRAAGFATFSVDYRPSQEALWPAARFDVANAIQYVKRNYVKFGISPDRIGIYGFSAGAQLAALMATIGAGEDRVRALIGVSGPYNPHLQWMVATGQTNWTPTPEMRTVAGWGVVLAGGPPITDGADWEQWRSMYAGNYASPDDAPAYLVHAKDDPAVPYTQTTNLGARWASGLATVRLVDEGGHGQAILWNSPSLATEAIEFMQRNTY